ncbi:MAG: type II toxin-antitoxin system prevent-host-death family antitoxin [Chloroflexi bacterium]|nr:type II toxin-antitoxin system prevent-host-death family antitoxin [Chloroflexota bacterium]MBP7043230.1 type II toxin-antitoxin system prevent-host-death family antitoxin [Chloroflexota bacterium]
MAEKIGVRELKNQTSQIVRAVREDMAEYVITLHGKPVAMLRPITEADEEALRQLETAEFLTKMDQLAVEIAADWHVAQTAVELVAEQRRG